MNEPPPIRHWSRNEAPIPSYRVYNNARCICSEPRREADMSTKSSGLFWMDSVMKKHFGIPRPFLPGRDFERRAKEILQRIQKDLLPEHASDIVAINVETGEYELGQGPLEAQAAFGKRWTGKDCYLVRADGGPINKFHGK
jgi:hypothetical protein